MTLHSPAGLSASRLGNDMAAEHHLTENEQVLAESDMAANGNASGVQAEQS